MSSKLNTLDVLTHMHEAQAEQFQRATLLAVGVVMRKLGVNHVEITPEDVDSLTNQEVLGVNRGVNGSLIYTIEEKKG